MAKRCGLAIRSTAPSVEVKLVFDGTVVAAGHLSEGPRGMSGATRLVLGAGGLALAGAAAAFAHAWIGGASRADDALFCACLIVAHLAIALGLARRFDERGARDFTLPGEDAPLVRLARGGFELCTAGGALPIPWGARIRVATRVGDVAIASTLPPRRYQLAAPADWWSRLTRGTSGVLFAAGVLALLPIFACVYPRAFGLDWDERRDIVDLMFPESVARRARVLIGPSHAREVATPRALPSTGPAIASTPPPPPSGGARHRTHRGARPVASARELAVAQASRVGAFHVDIIEQPVGPSLTELWSPLGDGTGTGGAGAGGGATTGGGTSAGDDDWGRLIGDPIDDTDGAGGLGLVGSGSSPCGGTELIGVGSLGTVGHGDGGGDYVDGTSCSIGSHCTLGHRALTVPDLRPGVAQVRGALDKELIRRVVRAHINEVRFCYERALQARPALAGRVAVEWLIGTSGDVVTARVESSTLGDGQVGACIAAAVRRWQFVAPRALGPIQVTYPFLLEPVAD